MISFKTIWIYFIPYKEEDLCLVFLIENTYKTCTYDVRYASRCRAVSKVDSIAFIGAPFTLME